ncbi:MAG: hypothetical protein QM612_12385 [Thermomonas sp.]|uniref:hypothetical protein n=1 Tax=Thermomonas sp. TaxID=1971895 RepID=UPI0039E28B93
MRRSLFLIAMLLAVPAVAEDVAFQRHVLDVDTSLEHRPIRGISGTQYAFPGTSGRIMDKAQACMQGVEGLVVASSDTEKGRLEVGVRIGYRKRWADRGVASKMTVEAGDGVFRITHSDLRYMQEDSGGYVPLAHRQGDWDGALEELIAREQRVIDCMFR